MKNQLGVRKLVKLTLRSGDLGALMHSENTAQNGSRIHRSIQRHRGKSYHAEYYLAKTVNMNGTKYLIHGRADGIIIRKHPLIEEIKTSDAKFNELPPSILKLYWGQVKTYAALFFIKHPQTQQIKLRLTYVQTPGRIVTKKIQKIKRQPARAFFKSLIREYAKWLKIRQRIVTVRNRSARKFKFPFRRFRPGQHHLAAVVYKTILFHKHLFTEAPTGTGKTISTLFPVVKAMGYHHTDRVFYLTAKKSTRHVAENTIKLMADHGLKIKSITLTAKEEIQFPSELNCDPDQNPYMLGYYDRLRPALRDVLTHQNQITPPVIVRYAKKYRLDPFEFSLDLSSFCDVIICDYNYLFDVQVYLQRFFAAHNPNQCFLIDEAHNLVSRSRDMYSASVSSEPLNQLIPKLRAHRIRCQKLITPALDLKRAFRSELKRVQAAKQLSLSSPRPNRSFEQTIKRFIHAVHKWLPKQTKRDGLLQAVTEYYFTCNSYVTIGGLFDSTYRTRVIRQPHHQITMRLFCIDPSQHLAKSLQLGGGAVLFSATLSPMNYYRRVLGNEPDSLTYRLPSPFPSNHQLTMITDYIQTTYRQRRANQSKIIDAIYRLIRGQAGHYLIFFPSYYYLNSVARDFHHVHPKVQILSQQADFDTTQQYRFVHRFRTHVHHTLVGFAILGSNFSEGIDLKGPALIGVGIVSVGLPKINAESDLVRDYFDDASHRGFEYAYQLPGLNKVLQAAGRLIRSAKDVGVVVLMDQRFSQFRYRKFLPRSWHPREIKSPAALQRNLKNFWQIFKNY